MINKKHLSAGMGAAFLLTASLGGCAEKPGDSNWQALVTDLPAGTGGNQDISAGSQSGEPSGGAQTPDTPVRSSASDKAADAPAATEFALKLFQQDLRQELQEDPKKNVLLSPVSVLYALSMTANGARGQTYVQMEETLGAPVSAWNTYLSKYRTSLPQGDGYKLSLANSIWFRDDPRFTVDEAFLKTNADWYGAGIYKAPFDASTVNAINSWVSDATDKMIPSILDEIPQDAVMYLINGLAFDSEWENIYKSDEVWETDFTEEDGTKYRTKQMRSTESLYLKAENAQGFLKYYKDKKYAFAALLPREGLSVLDYAASLDGQALRELLTNPVQTSVSVSIPKFQTDYGTEMSKLFSTLGMTDAFSGSADFSGIGGSTAGPLYISRILHKTYMAVDERGTKAGAVTAVEVKDECAVMMEQEVYLNRPFVYMIIDCEENVPVFIGALMSLRTE